VKIGHRIKLLIDIFDDGEDHHPPGFIAFTGEILTIREFGKDNRFLSVSHNNVTDSTFRIYPGEFELIQEQLELNLE